MNAQTHPFDAGIALNHSGDGWFDGTLDREWWIDFGPNGGFLASVMLNAILLRVDDDARRPRTLSVHFPGRAKEGPFEVETVIDRNGRSATFATARMYQQGQHITSALCALSTDRPGEEFHDAPPPDVAAPEDLQDLVAPPGMLPRFAEHFTYRPALGAFPYSGAERAEVGGWIRPKPARVVDPLMVATYADAFVPAAFTRVTRPFPIPTLDLTVHFRSPNGRGEGSDDFHLAHFTSTFAAQGFVEENGQIWDRHGKLVAQTRQLALHGTEMGEAPMPR